MQSKHKVDLVIATFIPMFVLLIIFPTLALICNVTKDGMSDILNDTYFWLSVKNTFIGAIGAALLGLLLAIGFGYLHVFHQRSAIYKIVDLFNDLPIALPHTVAGLSLLIAFGRNNFGFVSNTGFAFNLFAVMIAMFFVSYPLCARNIASGVDKIDHEMISVARTLGDSPVQAYFKIVLPSISEALFSGFVLAFSRALSEFAAVIMFGGNLPGKTQSLASYVFTKVEEGETQMAVSASVFCILLSFLIVMILSVRRDMIHARDQKNL